MKKIIKINILILLFSLLLILIDYKVIASSGKIISVTDIETEQITSDLLYEHKKMDSYFNTNSPVENEVYTYTLKNNSDNLKLATWTYSSQNGYQNKTLMEIAKDYEAKHPGYIVLGGINTEGYVASLDSNSVYELTNAFVQDGDVIRKDISAEETKEMIALNYNGSHVIKRVPQTSENPYLYVYSNDNYNKEDIINHLEIKYINTLPNDKEIAILTPKLSESLDLRGYSVYKCYYDMYRVTSNFPGGCISGSNYGIFFKGNILEKVDINEIKSVGLTNFYLITKDENKLNDLNPNTKIKVQYDYLDEFGEVESAVGYWFKYLENGVVCDEDYKVYLEEEKRYSSTYGSHDYYRSIYKERAGIGFKENGDVVILASNNSTRGPSQYEVGMYFKSIGCTDAYQFDGGGSVTFIKRDEMGNINMLNYPADGVARTILSGLFIVMKTKNIEVKTSNINENQSLIEVNVNEEKNYDKLIMEIKDGNELIKEVDVTNNKTYVSDLERNKNYTYHLYEIKDNIKNDTYISGSLKLPYLDLELIKINIIKEEGKYIYKVIYNDVDSSLVKMYMKVDKYSYKGLNNDEIIINDINIDPLNINLRVTVNNGDKTYDVLYENKNIIFDASAEDYIQSMIYSLYDKLF